MGNGFHYDLKIGYTCNNHCIHCVIDTNVQDLKANNIPIDKTYAQIIEAIDSEEGKNAHSFVVTGGEVTIRKEFIRVLKYITDKYPEKGITIQTNGRRLIDHLENIKEISPKIRYVVALHSFDEELHNFITGNRNGNPYLETMSSIKKLIEVYGGFKKIARLEIVLSKHNLHDVVETVKKCYEMGIDHVGISYPHLDGLYKKDKNAAFELSFGYSDLKPELIKLYDFAKENKDLILSFEEVPRCMWRDEEGNLLDYVENIRNMDPDDGNKNVIVDFPNHKETNFEEIYKEIHKKSEECDKCLYCCRCCGIWYEAMEMFGDKELIAIKAGDKRCMY